MLAHKQIRTLAKPYSDRTMIGKSDRCALGPESAPMWSNLRVMFFNEPKPKSTPKNFEPSALQPNNMKDIQNWCANPGVQVWPVEIGPLDSNGNGGDYEYSRKNKKSMILLRFADAKGHSHWFDARYVSAVMKRCSDPDWYYNENRLMAKDSTPVTIATDSGQEVTIPKGDPIAILMEWHWDPDATLAVDRYREWDPDWRLVNTSIKTWYILRWAQRLDRALPRGKQGNRFICLNGGRAVRRYKGGRHKYIEVASESGQERTIRISLYNGEVTQITQEITND